jgi:hypothetical protein
MEANKQRAQIIADAGIISALIVYLLSYQTPHNLENLSNLIPVGLTIFVCIS